MSFKFLNENYGVSQTAYDRVESAYKYVKDNFSQYEKIKENNQIKILHAFKETNLSQSDFSYTTGYGYGDRGREKTEEIFAKIFNTEDAFVRPAISSGTHALSLTLTSLLKAKDRLLSITDHPYDTLQEVIGIVGDNPRSLKNSGIDYQVINLIDNLIDYDTLEEKLKDDISLILIQRSTGYGLKRALTIEEIGQAISFTKERSPNTIVMVDNCYGEFTDNLEPSHVGADVVVGSLIKNPGGSIAIAGGYIVGTKEIIEAISETFYAPGLGKETGLTFDTTRSTLQGLFFAPHVTIESLYNALLFCKLFTDLGYDTYPKISDKRSDIIQAIVLNDKDALIEFVQAIQMAASVGAHVMPYPWEMPGYSDPVIMASGGFVDGSSIEISADGPLRPPYVAYYQGGVVVEQGKLAAMIALSKLEKKGYIHL